MLFFPNAKINIGLHIVKKRKDGYHNLSTVFYPISLTDVIEFVPAKTSRTGWKNTGIKVSGKLQDNLIIKAYNLLKQDFPLPALHIHLHKIIPSGAGLGGGSSNAAFMIKALNTYFSLGLNEKQLLEYAQKIGSDCPFFILNQPVHASGTGNIFTPVKLNLAGLYILLVKPSDSVKTVDAYKNVIPTPEKIPLIQLIEKPIEQWKDWLTNDFEPYALSQYPDIKKIKRILYEKGALFAQMSGSGSSIYGIFYTLPEDISPFQKHFTWAGKLA